MSKVTLAILYQYMEQANHEYYPKDKNGWCSFNRDEATEENTHKPIKDTISENISTLFQRCLLVDTTSRRGTTSNQR